jgi:hypothetical protein
MDTPLVAQVFKQLFSNARCQSCRKAFRLSNSLPKAAAAQRRWNNTVRGKAVSAKSELHWQQRSDLLQHDATEEFNKYPMVTAADLRARVERPRKVKMLMRDFIEGLATFP